MTAYASRNVGQRANVRYRAVDPLTGVLTDATVVLTVTDPDGITSTPSVTHTSVGIYDASILLSTLGEWSGVWTVAGAIEDVEDWQVYAGDPPPPLYATVDELRLRLGLTESSPTTQDSRMADALDAACRGIEKQCHRTFGLARTAPRLYYPDSCHRATVEDFVSLTEVAVDTGDGLYSQIWSAPDYQLEPLNGISDGEPGWPYWHIRAVGNLCFRCVSPRHRAPLRVTAKWGWAAVPAPVHEGALILAEEIYTLSKAPFGVGGYGAYGIIRARENPMVAARIAPYVRDAVLVG